jgi:C-terminal processing protease CtpA/Prc
MTTAKSILILFIVTVSTTSFAQDTLSKQEKESVINGIKQGIESDYVFIEKVGALNSAIDDFYESGKYDNIDNYNAFAQVLTDDLVAFTKDKHFAIGYNPKFVAAMRERRERANTPSENQIVEQTIDWNWWYGLQDNLGFKKVEVLDGNIGYIQITFFQPIDWTQSIIDATMSFVTNTDALIIDLTNNGGGYSPADSYLGSYFFNDKPSLWMSGYSRGAEEASSTYTNQTIGGPRYLDKPVYILVSDKSFSLAEQFSYSMKHYGKATIVGVTTSGASHSINVVDVNDNFILQVPNSYSKHPITESNWEGVGVIPHVKTTADSALDEAYLMALKTLENKATYERQKEKYRKVMFKLHKE